MGTRYAIAGSNPARSKSGAVAERYTHDALTASVPRIVPLAFTLRCSVLKRLGCLCMKAPYGCVVGSNPTPHPTYVRVAQWTERAVSTGCE